MSDSIKMTGRLLTFNKITLNNTMFSENCNFSYPDKVPFVRDFKNNDPSSVLGSANIYKDEKGLYCDVEIVGLDHDFLKENRSCELSIGGYYDKVNKDENTEN